MEKEAFLETCVVLSGLDEESIIKTILKEKFNKVRGNEYLETNNKGLPTGLDLLVHNPSPDDFAEYAYSLCSLQCSKDAMVKHLLSIQFDAAVDYAARPRIRTRQSAKKRKSCTLTSSSSAEDSEDSIDNSKSSSTSKELLIPNYPTPPAEDPKLPPKLNLFVRGDGKTIVTMAEILQDFFPGHVLLRPGIYRKGDQGSSSSSSFVLLVVDNGRYKNCWSSAGTQNKLTWYTSSDDVDRAIFDEVTGKARVVHVVRKRNSEMRYMGKSHKVIDIDKEDGSCVMYVA
ncbi:unnamed protein product [Sphacelaria rigidula]